MSRGEAPVAMITLRARIVRSPQINLCGVWLKSTEVTSACSNRVPKRVACFRKLSINA